MFVILPWAVGTLNAAYRKLETDVNENITREVAE